jgi:hypothetical protein
MYIDPYAMTMPMPVGVPTYEPFGSFPPRLLVFFSRPITGR